MAKEKELVLSKEDIIKKLLHYIEYWQEYNHNKQNVIFILKSLKVMIKRDSDGDWHSLRSR